MGREKENHLYREGDSIGFNAGDWMLAGSVRWASSLCSTLKEKKAGLRALKRVLIIEGFPNPDRVVVHEFAHAQAINKSCQYIYCGHAYGQVPETYFPIPLSTLETMQMLLAPNDPSPSDVFKANSIIDKLLGKTK
jgi:hypothetical protein